MTAKSLSLKNYQLPDKYGQWLGYKIHKIAKPGEVELTLKLRDDHLSPSGRIHGGVISGFFDFTCGAAVFTTMDPHDFCSTVEIKVNYFKPLESGDQILGKAKVIFRGKRLSVVEAFLYRNKETEPVAMATATFNIVTKK